MSDTPFLTDDVLHMLHRLRPRLGRQKAAQLGLDLTIAVHFKDEEVARDEPGAGLDSEFATPWEPGLSDGPTSARFQVMPIDGKFARWDAKARQFTDSTGAPVDGSRIDSPEYRQVRTWAVLQNTLDHVEGPFGMGRRIDWDWGENRLKVNVQSPGAAGAWYDAEYRLLKFNSYIPAGGAEIVHTCMSADVVNHELAHAILDGTRPGFMIDGELDVEINAFHEGFGDVLALLMALRNNRFRNLVGKLTEGDLTDGLASGVARHFGKTVENRPHLRSAVARLTMTDLPEKGFHDASQIMTGAVFGYLIALTDLHRQDGTTSVSEAMWRALRRVQTTFLAAIDLLPPIDPRFADLGRAMERATLIADPLDSKGYCGLLRKSFADREITWSNEDLPRLRLTPVDADQVMRSRAAAYRWLDENRGQLGIPVTADLTLAGPYVAEKRGPDARSLPLQISIPYTWMGGETKHEITTRIPCGGTLVIDTRGNVLSWVRKYPDKAGIAAAAGTGLKRGLCCAPGVDQKGDRT